MICEFNLIINMKSQKPGRIKASPGISSYGKENRSMQTKRCIQIQWLVK